MSTKPVIFISYAHADEPEEPAEGEVRWLTFVRRYLQPALKGGIFDLWVDRQMMGGAVWDAEIERKLRACDIFILLVSADSMASEYIIDKEIAIVEERQAKGDGVYFYPLLLTPTPDAGLKKVKDKNLRPRDAKPFSSFPYHERLQHMTDAADEIAEIAKEIVSRKGEEKPSDPPARPAYVHITGLPETAYERLVGREKQLQHLDDAWANPQTNILSLIAEGGAGKSALVNEWLQKMQADHYRGAEAVLGWSFYSQGSKERATSAEQFLDWALERLGIRVDTTSASAKGEAIAEAMTKQRVLLVLDGVEPLQHGLDSQQGELKDAGLRALLRRFATMPPTEGHGLVVITSRLAVKDIARRKDGAAPILDVEQLSEDAGAALLRDNGVWGIDDELKAATRAFGGHPLALGLLASFLRETQSGDVRRRDHIRAYLAESENPRHDHAKRVMESYEKWLAGQQVYRAVMFIVGLFDRPASGDCLRALRAKPAIEGLTDSIIALDEIAWHRTLARLRELRLLAPLDPSEPDAIDAHPLVREWFGAQLEKMSRSAWQAAHGRVYEYLRDATKRGDTLTLADLAPLYQAIAHGCRAGRHQEALDEVYRSRVCQRGVRGELKYYSVNVLGAFGSDLAALSWFFEKPYETPAATLNAPNQAWVFGCAASFLRIQGRLAEAILTQREGLRMREAAKDWRNAAISANNLSQTQRLLGNVAESVTNAQQAIDYAKRSGDESLMLATRVYCAYMLHTAGRGEEAKKLFTDAELQQPKQRSYDLPSSTVGHADLSGDEYFVLATRAYHAGHLYCDVLISDGDYARALRQAGDTIIVARQRRSLHDIGLDTLTIGRASLGLALPPAAEARPTDRRCDQAHNTVRSSLDEAIDALRASGNLTHIARGLLARAAFRRNVGDWEGTMRDLNDVEEIAEAGPMKLHLCDLALERLRFAFARIEAFAPLNGLVDDGPAKPKRPGEAERNSLHGEAAKQLAIAADYIERCGYHRRDDELAELQAVLKGARAFADLPPRV
jgi:tetratricopeptide (TPR) repeat protein